MRECAAKAVSAIHDAFAAFIDVPGETETSTPAALKAAANVRKSSV